LLGAFFTDGEAEDPGEDEDDLLVGVRVPGDDAALGELNAREHGLVAVHEFAREKRVELLGWDVGPGAVVEAVAHESECTSVCAGRMITTAAGDERCVNAISSR